MSLAVILVHYHAATWLAGAIAALEADLSSSRLEAELIVVDNGSRPAERARIASLGVRYVDAGGNRGYAGGVNLGVAHTAAERFVLMNPDVELQPGCVAALLEELAKGAAAAGPRFFWDRARTLFLPPTEVRTRGAELLRSLARRDRRLAPLARRSWRRHARRHWTAHESFASRSLSGAVLAVDRSAWHRVGPFDPDYKLYFEENDWLARAHDAGLRTVYTPAAAAVHHYNRSAASEPRAPAWFAESALKFSERHYGRWFTRFHERVPAGKLIAAFAERVPLARLRETPGGDTRLWVEISPSELGFPAASGILPEQCREWRPGQDLLDKLDPGHYSVRIVTGRGDEVSAFSFQHAPLDATGTAADDDNESRAANRRRPSLSAEVDAIAPIAAPAEPALAVAIIKPATPEDESSAERQFSTSWLANQARRVFGEARVFSPGPDDSGASFPDAPYVLLLGSPAVICTERSLDLLKQALDGGAAAAVPSSLAAFPQHLDPPPFSLPDYDRIESRVLDLSEAPAVAGSAPLPISLCTRAFFLALLQRVPLATLFTQPCQLTELFPAEPIARVGLYFAFNDYYGEVRKDVLPHLPPNPREVLEVGCGRAFTGQYLETELGCRVTGVELNPAIAEDARQRISRVLVGDAQTIPLEGPYDAIIATELVEHLTEPETFLRRVMRLLKPGGRLVLSIPNVGHHSVVNDLMGGRWDYVAAGLLCYTHVRFYTYRTLVDLLERSGLRHFRIVRQTAGLPETFRHAGAAFGADLESLRTHGFWVIAEREPERVGPFVLRSWQPGDERSINDAFNQIFGLTRTLDDWRWKFRATPDASRIMVAVNLDQQVVAQCALQRIEFQIGGQRVMVGHSVDALCRPDPEAIRRRLYVRTVRAAFARYGGSELAFLFGFPGKRAMRLGRQRLGFEEPVDVPVWRRSTDAEPASPVHPGYSVEPVCRRSDIDRIWHSAAARYAVTPRRDGVWLHRRYLDRPGNAYRSFTVFEQGVPRAWAILHVMGTVGQWAELVWDGADPDALILLDRAVGAAARTAGASRLELWLSGDACAAEVLRGSGWTCGRHEAELQMTVVLFDRTFDSRTILNGFYLTMGASDLV